MSGSVYPNISMQTSYIFPTAMSAMGYDILSFEAADSLKPDRYIEVKTYRGHKHFYWSEGEITAAHMLAERYYLYLVDYEQINNPGYQPEIIQAPTRLFDL